MVVLADDDLATQGAGALTAQIRIAFKLVTNDGDQAAGTTLAGADLPIAGQQIVQGFGWMERASLAVPHDDAITQPFEIQVDGEWEFVTST